MLDAENPGNESLPGSLIIIEQVPSLLICVSRNWFVFLRNWFVFWKIVLCFEKLFCVLVNWFVFWKIDLCFGKLFCVLVNWFVFDPLRPPYISLWNGKIILIRKHFFETKFNSLLYLPVQKGFKIPRHVPKFKVPITPKYFFFCLNKSLHLF